MKRIICILLFSAALLICSTSVMALTDLDKAVNRCKVEVEHFSNNVTNSEKVTFPDERFTGENANAYFVHYKEDLKATAQFKDGSTLPLDVRCTIEKDSFEPLFVNINGVSVPL